MKILMPEDMQDRVAVVVGTRPGIIKMSPLIRELEKRNIDHFVIHTGQHYSYELDRKLFEDLELTPAKYHLSSVGEYYFHGEQTAEMIRGVEQAILDGRPKIVLVCGDANTNLAAGLAARKMRVVVGHVESGLRSHDWSMPEEHNRIILDHISELLFAPTESTRQNLVHDNVRGEIHVTGNTIVDAAYQNLEFAKRKSTILEKLSVEPNSYIICTSHREENVDVLERLTSLLDGLELAADEFGVPVFFPVHPRTQRRFEEMNLGDRLTALSEKIRIIEPIGYLDFLMLLANSRLILTDSGGIQEESCILKVPCVTLRDNTERPETIEVGSNRIAGVQPDNILAAAKHMMNVEREWSNPYGNGTASAQIIDVVERVLKEGPKISEAKQVTS